MRFEATLDDKKKSKAAFGICLTCEKEKTIAMRLRYMDELICLGAVNKSCDPSDFPLNYKNVRKAHSFRCGMDSTKIKKIMCM